jgi:CobQ-like glutamine amidotransferase family enzyme
VSVTILNVLPELLNANGDAENARVLAMRARWADIDAEIVTTTDDLPSAVVIGSGFEADLPAVLAALGSHSELLRACVASDVPILAVAMGLDLLASRVQLDDGRWVDGLGIVPGEAALARSRAAGDIVAATSFGLVVGYENHSRSFLAGNGAMPLGTVEVGFGNIAPAQTEGAVIGSVIGTHVRGPVLAKNPVIADDILRRATGGIYGGTSTKAREIDRFAESAKTRLLRRVAPKLLTAREDV